MKLCSVVLVVALVAFVCVNGHGGGLGDILDDCANENGVDVDTLKKSIATGNIDGKVNCVFDCGCKKLVLMKADGSPNKAGADVLFARLPEKAQAAKGPLIECMSSMKPGLAKCASAGNFGKCLISKLLSKRLHNH